MKIAICDDSEIDRLIVFDLLSLFFSDKSIVYSITLYDDGTKLFSDVDDGVSYDVVFLDIIMDNQLGIDTARDLRRIKFNGDIVFLTSTAEYAVDSYDVAASGYLLKPHSFQKIKNIMTKIIKKYDISTYEIHRWNNVIRVPYNDILYVESDNNKCILHCVNKDNYIIYKKLNVIEKELNDPRFLRCHQSYLVNMNYIHSADDQFVLFTGDVIMIRRKNLKEIRNKYINYIKNMKKPD